MNVEQGGELRVRLDRPFVLEVADLEVEAFDLAVQLGRGDVNEDRSTFALGLRKCLPGKGTYQQSGLLAQADFFLLDDLRFVEVGHDVFAVAFFLWVRLTGSVQLEELLDAVVAGRDDVAALLDDSIFGLDLFEEMGDFGG